MRAQGGFIAGYSVGCAKPPHFARKKGLHSLPHKMFLHQGEGRGLCALEGCAGTLGGQQLLCLAAPGKTYLGLDPGTH